jgi:putative transposase
MARKVGLLSRWKSKPSRKGTGFEQPLQAHQHWHIDISYINLSGTFYSLCNILDGFSRFLVHWVAKRKLQTGSLPNPIPSTMTGPSSLVIQQFSS